MTAELQRPASAPSIDDGKAHHLPRHGTPPRPKATSTRAHREDRTRAACHPGTQRGPGPGRLSPGHTERTRPGLPVTGSHREDQIRAACHGAAWPLPHPLWSTDRGNTRPACQAFGFVEGSQTHLRVGQPPSSKTQVTH